MVETARKRQVASLIAAAGLSLGLHVAMAPEASAAALPCQATISHGYPKQYSTVSVTVKSVAGARVTTSAFYKTTTNTKATTTSASGYARTAYAIARATVGYRVIVKVSVAKGAARGACATSFVPRA